MRSTLNFFAGFVLARVAPGIPSSSESHRFIASSLELPIAGAFLTSDVVVDAFEAVEAILISFVAVAFPVDVVDESKFKLLSILYLAAFEARIAASWSEKLMTEVE